MIRIRNMCRRSEPVLISAGISPFWFASLSKSRRACKYADKQQHTTHHKDFVGMQQVWRDPARRCGILFEMREIRKLSAENCHSGGSIVSSKTSAATAE